MSQRTAAPHTSPSDEDVEQDEERQQMKEVNRAVEWRERLTPQMIMNGAMEWEHNGTDETEEGVEGSQVRVRGPSDRWPCLWWGRVCGGVCMVVCVWWYAGGVPLAPECSGQPVCAWPPWPLPRSVPEPEPWPCQSLRQQTSINTKTYYRASCCCDTRADTHSHTHSTHVSGYATLQSTNKSFLNSIFSQTLCGYVQSNNHLYAFSEAHILFHYRV